MEGPDRRAPPSGWIAVADCESVVHMAVDGRQAMTSRRKRAQRDAGATVHVIPVVLETARERPARDPIRIENDEPLPVAMRRITTPLRSSFG